MLIRKERESEFDAIHAFIIEAFKTSETPDDTVQDYVRAIRENPSKYEPELALVAEIDGKIIGYIMSMKSYVETPSGRVEGMLAVAPLAVDLELRKQGIGRKLMNEMQRIAAELGYKGAFLAGNPDYYTRLGYTPSYEYDIIYEDEALSKAIYELTGRELRNCIMAYELSDGALDGVSGKIALI
ncbi:MAG: N-acetyltransferase [Deferribacteraceae bacterium]|jgi:putative acetyltransferase|nr:N-acetyltransferase [Deferribacteraceae bacterium]